MVIAKSLTDTQHVFWNSSVKFIASPFTNVNYFTSEMNDVGWIQFVLIQMYKFPSSKSVMRKIELWLLKWSTLGQGITCVLGNGLILVHSLVLQEFELY